MEKIALESLRLIAADYVSQQVIDELCSEGIYSIKNSTNVHVIVVLVSTDKGVDNVNEILETHARARRNVVIKRIQDSVSKKNLTLSLYCLFRQIAIYTSN